METMEIQNQMPRRESAKAMEDFRLYIAKIVAERLTGGPHRG